MKADRKNGSVRWDNLRYAKRAVVVRFFSDLFAIAMPTINALLIGDMADYLIALDAAQIKRTLPAFLLAMVFTILVTPLLALLENLILTQDGFDYDRFLVVRLLRRPVIDIELTDLGEVMQRLEIDASAYNWNTVMLCSRPAVILGYAGVICWTALHSGMSLWFLLVLVLVPALPVLKAHCRAKTKAQLRRAQSEYDEERRGAEADVIPSQDFLHQYGLTGLMKTRLQAIYQTYAAGSGGKKWKFDSQDTGLDHLLTYGVPLCVLAVGGALVRQGSLSIGGLLTGYLMLSAVQECYTYLSQLVEEIHGAKEYEDRIRLIYGALEPEEEPISGSITTLQAQDVSFSYPGSAAPAVSHRTVTLSNEGVTRISGPNGSGKSTLLALLSGLYPPESGEICDQNGQPLSIHALRQAVSLQEQTGTIFSGTLVENLFLSPGQEERAQEILNRLGLEKPLSYPVESNGANLSPGEQKKVLLARMLLKSAPFYFLDEPLNHLDEVGKQGLISLLNDLPGGIVYVSHQQFLPEKVTQVVGE
jgi:ABC-type bacteriocin/lantibiotic exporter with double-glycine peptidase domain